MWAKIASVAGSFFVADSWRLSAGSSPVHSIWCRWFPQSAGRRPRSLFGRSTGAALRPLSGGYTGGWCGTGDQPGFGYRRWLVYPSGGWGDALPHVSVHAVYKHQYRSHHWRVRAYLCEWSSAPTAVRAQRVVAHLVPVL